VLEKYFGFIEGAFVFCMLGFYLWQRHTLKRDIAARTERERLEKRDQYRQSLT